MEAIAGKEIEIPSYFKLIKYVSTNFDDAKAKLIEIVHEQDYICITTDVWSSRAQSYLGLTLHYITPALERKSFMLAFRQLREKQTYLVLANTIHRIIDEFQIPLQKVTHIVTDGGSAFCKAFKEFGSAEGALIDESESTDEEDENTNVVCPFMRCEDGEVFLANNIDLNSVLVPDSVESEMPYQNFFSDVPYPAANLEEDNAMGSIFGANERSIVLPPQKRCLSHILNLATQEFEKKLNGLAQKCLIATISKLHCIWVRTKRSSAAKQICKDVFGITLKIPCVTRWNSQFPSISKNREK